MMVRNILGCLVVFCLNHGFKMAVGQDQSTLTDAVQNLGGLLAIDLPSKGTPFPKIPGPSSRENICIVGAGPAGIHMAVGLKDMGFTDITIFEKTGRVGGKSYDTQIDGVYRSQGTVYLTADYFDNVIELAKRYNVGELHPLSSMGVC